MLSATKLRERVADCDVDVCKHCDFFLVSQLPAHDVANLLCPLVSTLCMKQHVLQVRFRLRIEASLAHGILHQDVPGVGRVNISTFEALVVVLDWSPLCFRARFGTLKLKTYSCSGNLCGRF